MTNKIFSLALFLLVSGVQADRNNTSVVMELINDRHFEQGFCVLNPTHGIRVVEGYLNWDGKTKPVWDLPQWHSKFSIAGVDGEELGGKAKRFSNAAKTITVCAPGEDKSDLTLTLDSRPEFEGRFREDSQPWPHLLVEQSIADCPSMAEIKELRFHIEAKLLEAECNEGEGYRKSAHTAQMPFVIVIRNSNKSSAGYGDFGWFMIPLYDYRYRDWPVYIAQDKADPSSKLIYNPGAKACGIRSLHDRDWVTVDTDVLPILIKGMKEAWKRGYLTDSQDLRDYRISSINMGWEVTGLAKASIQIRNLSMKAITEALVK